MTSSRNDKFMNLVKTLDDLRRHMTEQVCQLTVQAAEAYPVMDSVILEILMETLISSTARLTIDILTVRYRMLKAFIEENPELSLLSTEPDFRAETAEDNSEVRDTNR